MDVDHRFDSSDNRETQVGPRSIVRRLASRWRRMLLLWLLLATPVAYLIYTLDEPIYEAFSLLQVEPAPAKLFVPGGHVGEDRLIAQPYLETQVQLISSDKVLEAALSQPASTTTPAIAKLPMIAGTKDPEAHLRKELVVEIVKNTFLIRVALASREPEEAAAIVNAVVNAYLEQHSEYHRSANKTLRKSLEDEREVLKTKIKDKQDELKTLIEKGNVAVIRPEAKTKTAKEDDPGIQSALTPFTEEQYTKVADRLIQADLDLIDAQARLETAKLARRGPDQSRPGNKDGQPADATHQRSNPETSIVASEDKLHELEAAVEEVKRKRIGYAQYIRNLEIQNKTQNNDNFGATLANQELATMLRMQDVIEQKLEQLRFEQKQDVYRVTRHDEAQVPKVPASHTRPTYMSAASLGILFLIVGLFLTREIKATRVADTDESGTSLVILELRPSFRPVLLPSVAEENCCRGVGSAHGKTKRNEFRSRTVHDRTAYRIHRCLSEDILLIKLTPMNRGFG